jgi:hypothetical protein
MTAKRLTIRQNYLLNSTERHYGQWIHDRYRHIRAMTLILLCYDMEVQNWKKSQWLQLRRRCRWNTCSESGMIDQLRHSLQSLTSSNTLNNRSINKPTTKTDKSSIAAVYSIK